MSPVSVTLQGEGFEVKREVILFLVTNTPVVGGFKNIASKANMGDGLLDLIVLKKCSFEQLVVLLIQAFKGKGEHLNSPLVEYYQSDWFKITSSENMQANIDGELGPDLPLDIKVLPGSLRLLLPLKK